MLIQNGNQKLREFTETLNKASVSEVVAGVWFVSGYGHSNAIFIEGQTSVILIDTLDSRERGGRLRTLIEKKTGKSVKTILYTHSHPDHRGGAEAFECEDLEIIAFKPMHPELERTEALQTIQTLRGQRQFGYTLSDEEALSQGIGPREGINYGEHRGFLSPGTVIDQAAVSRTIDGIELELVRLPGEAEDQMMIWLPQKEVLCCGDNYFGCFPNLYAIRGGQYRDLAAWIASLDVILSYPAQILLPGHTAAVVGKEQIQEVVGHYRKAMDFILTTTLEGMNAGKSADQLAAEIRLPDELARLPYLGEYYGCAEWAIREIYSAYLGWFDGNPTHLHPLPPSVQAQKMLELMGGKIRAWGAAQEAFENREDQWCLELCDLCYEAEADPAILRLKAAALKRLADKETSANGRHYYLACAKELEEGN